MPIHILTEAKIIPEYRTITSESFIYNTAKQKSEKRNLINFCSSNALSDSDSLGGEGVGGQGGQGDEAEQGGGQREVGEQSHQPVEGEKGLEQDPKDRHFNSSGTQ